MRLPIRELDIDGKIVKLGDLLRLVADGPITSESAAAVHQTSYKTTCVRGYVHLQY